MIVWLVGLSGSGKTTIGRELVARWPADRSAVLVDGDDVRALFDHSGEHVDHSLGGRRRNAERTVALCEWADAQGLDVVCCQVSLFEELRRAHAGRVGAYLEVFVDTALEVVEERDTKGLYGAARRGELRDVVGVDLEFPRPRRPDLVVDGSGSATPGEIAEEILAAVAAAESDYPWVHGDYGVRRPLYDYATTGEAVLDGWRDARDAALAHWSAAPEPMPPVRRRDPVVVPESGAVSIDVLLDAADAGAALADGTPVVELLVQRFEAGKRLYDRYRAPACTGIVDSGYDDVDRYLRLGEILLAEVEGPRRLIATNCLLKLGDLLCSRAAELDPVSAARARALLSAERTIVDALAERGS